MPYTLWVVFALLCLPGSILSQNVPTDIDSCIGNACYPSTGDLLVGRGDRLYASSTCGSRGRVERFCVISELKERDNCFWCDSRPTSGDTYSHAPRFMEILFNEEAKKSWWQSENGKENVYLQLDFGAQFHVTHIVMKWKSFRPAAMLIEKSFDYQRSWNVSRYYAKNCAASFPGVPVVPQPDITSPYCSSDYSDIEPSSGGEVVYKALKGDEDASDVKIQNLLRMTNIRINFTKLNTLGDDIIDNSLETNRNYYYAVNWISIRGSCSCYGHAKQCLPGPNEYNNKPGMVHRICNCTHNTKGVNCEECKDLYNDLAWEPAVQGKPFECKKCECHGHADKCTFNPAVFEASGGVSGGVCTDCKHNTIGVKCEKCKPLHYKDPNLPISDPNICKPCDCDPVGAVGRGECEMEEDPSRNRRAGQCICKENVGGERCDRCKSGYFNLQQDNQLGCEPCGCNSDGSVHESCDALTGKCRCHRFVEGEKCDKCFDGYWNLKSGDGCDPCDCDPGGAYDNFCDVVTGQCRCRPGIEGQKCDRVIPGFYYALSDNLKYEGEDARGIGETSVNLLERPQGTDVVWTDVGSLNISEGNGVEFVVTNVPHTGNYKILMRFHPQTFSSWEEVKLTVSRADGQRTINGACGNTLSSNGYSVITTVQLYEQYKLLDEMVCLEKDVHYYVRLDFNKRQGRDNHANLDSLVLIPDMNSVSIFQGDRGRSRLNDFTRFRCDRISLRAKVPRPEVHSVCKKLHFSGSAVIYDGAIPCDCNQIGTIRNASGIYTCNDAAGQCPCKPNVIGRRCLKCAPGTYNFGPNGCSPCNCDLRGSDDNLCDVVTGQCKCNGLGTGRQCNECPVGQWGFPRCRPCECNGHASRCDSVTGVCIDCLHNTAGDNCELCKAGYFGDATKGTSTDCQQCQCPGGSSENQFSPTCRVDTSTTPPTFICDQCPPGYEGKQCEECSDGYYGNPLIPGGKCQKCNCSGNVDFTEAGGCDKKTGICLRCLHNTAGYFCDVCKPGFFGNAKNQTCQPCICNEIGTNSGPGAGPCNASTGQCPCKPNVVGLSCDRCAPGHWNLASGDGCESCDCCAFGSTKSQCDQSSGVCECRRDFGGEKCCDCEEGFWGVPPGQCRPCDCNPSGSVHTQCNKETGECVCKDGVTGKKCNKCKPETTQEFPECEACHECYYSWDKIITELEKIASRLKGATGGNAGGPVPVDYKKDLDELEELVRRIEYILDDRTTYPEHLEEIKNKINTYRAKIMVIMNNIDQVHEHLGNTSTDMKHANNEILKLRKIYERLRVLVKGQLRNLTLIEGKKPGEALNDTQRSLEVSIRAFDLSNEVRKIIEESAKQREEMDNKVPGYNKTHEEIRDKLKKYEEEFVRLNDIIARINEKLCGANQTICGGCTPFGCDNCGGDGCDGAIPLATQAVDKATLAERKLWEKERDANATLAEVVQARITVDNAMKEAKIALELAKAIQIQASNDTDHITVLIAEIYKYLNRSSDNAHEVRRIAEFVLGRSLTISEEGIKELGRRIKDAVNKLTGIDQILIETARELSTLENLKQEAIQANSSATNVAGIAKEVTDSLANVVVVQDGLRTSLKKAKRKIKDVEIRLLEVETIINKTLNKSIESVRLTTEMKRRIGPLEKKFEENEKLLKVAETEVKDAVNISSESKTDSAELKKRFDDMSKRYQDKLDEQKKFRNRTEKALDAAKKVKSSLIMKLRDLESYLIRRKELEDLIEKLKKLEDQVDEKYCEITLDTANFKICIDEGTSTKVPLPAEGYCERLKEYTKTQGK
ncbi:laminin subunit beta-1-like [Dendronephthya gigantea]|uniref:laminin subunit beta-1-like n=1 Tax=Dendronephthya gigantea TaxID=151771 RepID=UPI00106BC56C|nr:laminin subunit beta-1-like [Dendronephthya gigantea]